MYPTIIDKIYALFSLTEEVINTLDVNTKIVLRNLNEKEYKNNKLIHMFTVNVDNNDLNTSITSKEELSDIITDTIVDASRDYYGDYTGNGLLLELSLFSIQSIPILDESLVTRNTILICTEGNGYQQTRSIELFSDNV